MPWSRWRPFPNPRQLGVLHAPVGPGVYDLRRRSTKKPVLFGIGANVAARLCTILPESKGGAAGRNNAKKRNYVARHRNDIEYRTLATKTREEAADIEREIKRTRGHEYSFPT
ncbi:MAG: hypothetical protein H6810_06135 [Phycisphaeraceae bacterium]|nr:MAG: hypothetical protein H6810_06135 [Phycisphaeraceae bacterium]